MPIHDWTRVDSGTFHDFHQVWTIEIRNALNRGILPPGYFAMADQRVTGPEPDVVALQTAPAGFNGRGGVAVAVAPPRVRQIARIESESTTYARKANRIAIRHRHGRVVAMIEVVSPGNKDSKNALRSFASKIVDFLRNGIHFLVIDLFPPSVRDPRGIHAAIWEDWTDIIENPPSGKPLTAVAYDAGDPLTAYVEPLAVGDCMADMPLFLEPGIYVPVPLEATYQASWDEFPLALRHLLEPRPN